MTDTTSPAGDADAAATTPDSTYGAGARDGAARSTTGGDRPAAVAVGSDHDHAGHDHDHAGHDHGDHDHDRGSSGTGLGSALGDDSIGHVFDQTNGVVDGLDGDSDGSAASDTESGAERGEADPGFDHAGVRSDDPDFDQDRRNP